MMQKVHFRLTSVAQKRCCLSSLIRELAHFTNPEAADQIVNDHGSRGGLKKINKDENDDDIIANLSWWSPIFTQGHPTAIFGKISVRNTI